MTLRASPISSRNKMDNQFSTQALIAKGSQVSGGADASKIARWLMILATCAGIGYVAWRWVLPMMVDIVWDIAQIVAIGVPTLLVLGFVLSQTKNIFAFYDIMADKMFGKLVQMAPFRMQEKRIEHAESNYTTVQGLFGHLKGAYDRVLAEYNRQLSLYNIAVKAEELARRAGDEDAAAQAQRDQGRTGGFVQVLEPQKTNMGELVEVVGFGLKRMKEMIADAKVELQESKTVFDVTMTGAAAMTHMQAAMQGDAQINSDAERSAIEVMKRISLAVGQTQAAMEIVQDITKVGNLKDAAKLAVARDQLKSLGTTDIRAIPVQQGSLHYQGMAKQMNTNYPIE